MLFMLKSIPWRKFFQDIFIYNFKINKRENQCYYSISSDSNVVRYQLYQYKKVQCALLKL